MFLFNWLKGKFKKEKEKEIPVCSGCKWEMWQESSMSSVCVNHPIAIILFKTKKPIKIDRPIGNVCKNYKKI